MTNVRRTIWRLLLTAVCCTNCLSRHPGNAPDTPTVNDRDTPGYIGPAGRPQTGIRQDDTENTRTTDGKRIVERPERTSETNGTRTVCAYYEGKSPGTDRIYRIGVVFEDSLARIALDGTVFDLPQFAVSRGFGYGNGMMRFCGENSRATLTMRDGLKLDLTLCGNDG